jgi:hypothetical protein
MSPDAVAELDRGGPPGDAWHARPAAEGEARLGTDR